MVAAWEHFFEDTDLKSATSITAKLMSVVCMFLLASTLTLAQGSDSTPADKKSTANSGTPQSTSAGTNSAAKSSVKKTSAVSHKSSSKGKRTKKSASSRHRGQQKIDSERTQEIQQALAREHYLTGEPSGKWDDATQKALQKYQADHGWQSKTVPDSRALIQLGLGPSHDHLLNPESAMTGNPSSNNLPPANNSSSSSSGTQGPSNPSNQPQ